MALTRVVVGEGEEEEEVVVVVVVVGTEETSVPVKMGMACKLGWIARGSRTVHLVAMEIVEATHSNREEVYIYDIGTSEESPHTSENSAMYTCAKSLYATLEPLNADTFGLGVFWISTG